MINRVEKFVWAMVGGLFLSGLLLRSQAPVVTQPSSIAAEAESHESSSANAAIKPHNNSYIIGNADVLDVNVWKEPEISRSLPVRSDGRISLPLVGEMQAAGKTPFQLEQAIAARLREYITNPEVTVMLEQTNSEKFNILGMVQRPGSYPLALTTTVLDAIAEAGGFRDFARQKKIYVLRQNAQGIEARIPFNYKDVIKGKHPEQNINIQPNDTIVVP